MGIKHIMVAHDLSEHAHIALQRAWHLAQQHGARLTVLHVMESHLPPAVLKQNQIAAQELIDQQVADLGAQAELIVVIGRPAQSIVAQQRARSVDLLVMGDHHQDSPQYFTGTTLERVLQRSSAPVLLAVSAEPAVYQQALVPMDFSRCACNALHAAYALLPESATIHAVHILEHAHMHTCDTDEHEWQEELFAQLIVDEQKKMPAQGPAISHALHQGELHSCLSEILAQQKPQLLAVGKHGRGVLADVLLGSLAQYFLEHPPCDVLLVR